MTETEEDQVRWEYNCLDVSYTLEIAEILEQQMLKQPQTMQDFYSFQQHELAPALVNVMKRGVRVDLDKKEELYTVLSKLMEDVRHKLNWLIGEDYNPNSNPQNKKVFTELLGITAITGKSGNATFGADAMITYLEEYPIFKPFLTLLLEYRSLKVFVGTFLAAQVDEDGRMRSSYNIAGTATYRLASRKNAFGNGMNLQNIPSKGKIDLRYSLAQVDMAEADEVENNGTPSVEVYGTTELPNCKELFIPDEGYTFFDVDYSGADAMVVAWDSDCKWLQNFFTTQTKKLYIYIGEEYLQRELTVTDPLYKKFKQFIHLTNYGGGYEKAGRAAGMTSLEAKDLQKFYFKLCPEIPKWHKRIKDEVYGRGYIENIFGARGYFLNKSDHTLLNKAYAWIPQSTIGIMVNKGLVNIENERNFLGNTYNSSRQAEALKVLHLEETFNCFGKGTIAPIEVLMQVHDSLAGQFQTNDLTASERIVKHMSIELPYPTPLVIPAEISTSVKSYGDC